MAASMITGPGGAGLSQITGMFANGQADTAWLIIREIRLPRTVLAAMIGFTLGLAGAALQGFLRNPLADPGVIGVTSTASLGAELSR
jgi:iron complex transport system permease protein